MRLFLLALVALTAVTILPASGYSSDERMPGRVPVAEKKKEDKPRKTAPAKKPDSERTKPVSSSAQKAPGNTAEKKAEPRAEDKKEEDVKADPPVKTEEPKPAAAPDDTATKDQKDQDNAAPEDSAAAPAINTPQPRVGMRMNVREMENLGPLTNPLLGSLGNDLWDGTARSTLQRFIPQLPAGDTDRPLQLLTRRVLLTNGDVGMLRNDVSSPGGADLFTLRLEKLLEIGAFHDAVSLYTLIEGEPAHDRLARAGVIALMQGGYPAQACLEANVANRDSSPDDTTRTFWVQVDALCTFIQGQSLRKASGGKSDGLMRRFFGGNVEGSRVISSLVSRSNYRHIVDNPADIESLSGIERAALRGLGRLDYSRFKMRKLQDMQSVALMTMALDPNMPASTRMTLHIEAARRGLIDPETLGAFYLTLAEGPSSAGLPARYMAYTKAETTSHKADILGPLLDGGDSLISLLPFAQGVADINPDGLSPNGREKGLDLILQAGIVPPAKWVVSWLRAESGDSNKSRESILLYLANLLPENLPTESVAFPDEALKPLFADAKSAEALEIWAIFSGLNRTDVLKNIADLEVYEKHVDLTVINDYVMPVDSVMELIRDAAANSRIGETALLSAVALKNHETGKTHPAVLRDVLRSLETVGLKEEARKLALGVLLGFK